MKNKVAFIVPYFGTLPNYFYLWLNSASWNTDFDFMIFTDNIINIEPMRNIKVINTSFSNFKDRIQALFDFKISLSRPYKLCDYRPVYGAAFEKELQGYDFWGHCDVDLIFGDLKKYITDEVLDKNDRIYNLGHCTLYRNCETMNNLYRICHDFDDCFSYKYAYTTDFSTSYDEIGTKYGCGLSTICERIKIKNYISLDFADIDPERFNFELVYTEGEKADYFAYEAGKIVGVTEGSEKEYAYVHLQKRIMSVDVKDNNKFYISPIWFRSTIEAIRDDLTSKEQRKQFEKAVIVRKIKSKENKLKSNAVRHYLNRVMRKINI